jgi:tRNA-Thr(GGU) m(6)t(6)A37 methyltransferase TsaA
MNTIELRPVGIVRSADDSTAEMPLQGKTSVIEIFPEYAAALERIGEYSHLWILSWFHEAKRDVLATVPSKVNPDLPRYGVFSLRTPMRPNPIALTLVTLNRISNDSRLYVSGLDAVNGTPVLDIKPYYEQDIVFSPRTARITAAKREVRKSLLEKEALLHHREVCPDLRIAVRMALIAEERLGKLNDDDLKVEVTGSPCFGDVLQGLARGRLANPARFGFTCSSDITSSTWLKSGMRLAIEFVGSVDVPDWDTVPDEELFRVKGG